MPLLGKIFYKPGEHSTRAITKICFRDVHSRSQGPYDHPRGDTIFTKYLCNTRIILHVISSSSSRNFAFFVEICIPNYGSLLQAMKFIVTDL